MCRSRGPGVTELRPGPCSGGGQESQETSSAAHEQAEIPQSPAFERGFAVRSPFGSTEETDQILVRLIQELALVLDYEQLEPSEQLGITSTSQVFLGEREPVDPTEICRMNGLPGLDSTRCLFKSTPERIRTIELAMSPGPHGVPDVMVYGLELTPEGRRANPDVARAKEMLGAHVEAALEPPPAPDAEDLERYIYTLSYTQADRALAALKTVGYNTVEFEQTPGESDISSIYAPVEQAASGVMAAMGVSLAPSPLPVIVKLIDAPSTALVDDVPTGAMMLPVPGPPDPRREQGLQNLTTAGPLQRLMIVYDANDRASLVDLLNLLREDIDVAAKQVVIEALVVELSAARVRELGINFARSSGDVDANLNQSGTGDTTFGLSTFVFDSDGAFNATSFKLSLSALFDNSDAELLASPSVLVLDGRQARIDIARKVPVLTSEQDPNGKSIISVEYESAGIMLNLRPRVSADSEEVSLQVEANVSAVGPNQDFLDSDKELVASAPPVETRTVESSVRLANDTPFIIGGLIQEEVRDRRTGIPVLSWIPLVGNLFKRTERRSEQREVIIVITPHVVPVDEASFRYVLPNDSDIFDSFDRRLFRDAYRIRDEDAFFNLESVKATDEYRDLVARVEAHVDAWPEDTDHPAVAGILDGRVPGEEVLARRMMWELVRDTGHGAEVPDERVIFFEANPQAADGSGFELRFLRDVLPVERDNANALELSFDAGVVNTLENPLARRNAQIRRLRVGTGDFNRLLREGNARGSAGEPPQSTILLTDAYQGTRAPLALLKDVLVMQRIIQLNSTLDLTLDAFRTGRQLVFPTRESLRERFHVIDREVARYFYEAAHYYAAFQAEYRKQRAELEEVLTARQR